MNRKLNLLLKALPVLGVWFLMCGSIQAQGAPSKGLVTRLKQQLTQTDLIVQKPGIVGVPSNQAIVGMTTFTTEDHVVHSPGTGQRLVLGGNTRNLPAGDKVQINDIRADFNKDKIILDITECASCNGAAPDAPSYRAFVVFQFSKGYLEGSAGVDQIVQAIAELLAIDAPSGATADATNAPPSQDNESPQAPELTNDDVLKMVQAKLPDSVIVAKIQASSCQFNTSPDALISLQQAGASESVLKAMTEAPAAAAPVPSDSGAGPPAICSEYSSCMSSGKQAMASARWSDALAAFQVASSLNPLKPDAWEAIGDIYLATGRMDEVGAMWDRALGAGGSLAFSSCHQTLNCRRGTLGVGPKLVSFTSIDGKIVFSASPAEVTPGGVLDRKIYRAVELRLIIAGKNYNFYFVPFGVVCRNQEAVDCPQDGIEQQRVAFDYISQAIPKLAAGGKVAAPSGSATSGNPESTKN